MRGLGSAATLASEGSAAAGDTTQRLARVNQLQADYAATREEMEEVTLALRRDVAAYESERNEPFLYQGRRLAEQLW